MVKRLLKELDGLAKDGETWGAKLQVLQENVEHHVEEEEGEMFPKAREVLSAEEVDALGERLAAAKEQQMKSAAAG